MLGFMPQKSVQSFSVAHKTIQRFVALSCIEICNESFSYADPMAVHYYLEMRFLIVDDQSAKWSTSPRHLGNITINDFS
jgi:predicted phosphoribosyltransferase